jgi:hypothetical protein
MMSTKYPLPWFGLTPNLFSSVRPASWGGQSMKKYLIGVTLALLGFNLLALAAT